MNIFDDNNVLLLIFSILPALFYSFIIFARVPYGTLKVRPSLIYLLIGLTSVTILGFFQFTFPHIQDFVDYNIIGSAEDGFLSLIRKPTVFGIFIKAFFQIALLEELSKFIAFKLGNFSRGKYSIRKDKPFSIMFYAAMISVGFAFIENISYAARAIWGDFHAMGIEPEHVLMVRSISAVVLHMIAGLFMGYFLSVSRRFKPLRKALFAFIGIMSAVFIHGAYDFLLMIPNSAASSTVIGGIPIHIPTMTLLALGIMTAYFMASNLLKRSKKN